MGISGLSEKHRPEWAFNKLYMNKFEYNPEMEKFINLLIENASGRLVLQFNRVDFRLPWLKSHYPNATFLHLFRNPRDQWIFIIQNDFLIPKDYELNKNDIFPKINPFLFMGLVERFTFLLSILKVRLSSAPISNSLLDLAYFLYVWKRICRFINKLRETNKLFLRSNRRMF